MAKIRILNGKYTGREFEIPLGERRTFGRSSKSNFVLPDPKLSRRHCVIESGMLGFLITDLESSNGTWVKGQRISEASLVDGDELTLGDTKIRFIDEADYYAQATQVAINTRRSKMAVARMAMLGEQEGYISAKSHFCETCGGHIVEEDRESGASKKIETVWVCSGCVEEMEALSAEGTVKDIKTYMGFRRKRELAERLPDPGVQLDETLDGSVETP